MAAIEWLTDPKGKGTVTYRLILVAMIAYQILSKDYVSKVEYQADKTAQATLNDSIGKALTAINNTLLLQTSQVKLNADVKERLDDHEARIRSNENARQTLEQRVNFLERKR